MPSCAAGANSRDLTFRVEHTSDGVTFHGALNSYAWVRHRATAACPQPGSTHTDPPLTQTLTLTLTHP